MSGGHFGTGPGIGSYLRAKLICKGRYLSESQHDVVEKSERDACKNYIWRERKCNVCCAFDTYSSGREQRTDVPATEQIPVTCTIHYGSDGYGYFTQEEIDKGLAKCPGCEWDATHPVEVSENSTADTRRYRHMMRLAKGENVTPIAQH